MFTSCYKAVFTCLFCVTTAFSVFADSPRAAYEQARQEALCAWMAMASYGDRPGLAARQELVRRGWHIDSQVQKDDKSEAKFHLARKGDDTLLFALARRPQRFCAEVYVAELQAAEFARPQAAAVSRLEEGSVP